MPPLYLFVEPEMLGPWADEDDAEMLVEILNAKGYPAVLGPASENPHDGRNRPATLFWDAYVERVWQARCQPMVPFAAVEGGEWVND